MVQRWVNLPAEDKMSAPKFQSMLDADIPSVDLFDRAGRVRVIAIDGVRGPTRTRRRHSRCSWLKVMAAAGGKKMIVVVSISGAVALGLMAAAVSAQSNVDCDKTYKGFSESMNREKTATKMSGERLAALNRRAQRIYDACQTGDLNDAKALFEGLDRWKD
jgi:hypothetical protein